LTAVLYALVKQGGKGVAWTYCALRPRVIAYAHVGIVIDKTMKATHGDGADQGYALLTLESYTIT
jgi:hypothetical protein